MKKRQVLFQAIIFTIFISNFLATGCAPQKAPAPAVNIAGASDVIHIAEAAQDGFQKEIGIQINASTSKTAFEDLQNGKADVILVGRELSAAQLQGLESRVVAYDAVCVLVSLRTYQGGIEQGNVGGLTQPASRFDGIKNLSLDDLKGHMANILNLQTGKNYWYLAQQGYYTFQPYLVGDTLQVKQDPDSPGQALGDWVWNYVPLGGELSIPGMTDAQTFLLQKLGFGQTDLTKPDLGFTPRNVASEEEWISSRFNIMPEEQKLVSSVPFNFFVLPASRQVTVRALQHGFSLRAISIDGIDPLADPKAIYDGTYPLGRKIYVLAKQPLSENASKVIDYLLSVQGQKGIENASYLPLPK